MKNTACLRIILAGMSLCGVWVPEGAEKKPSSKYTYHIYALLYRLLIYLPLISIELMHLYSVLDDVEAVMNVSMLFLTHLTTAPKVYIIWHRQDQIKSLLRLLDSETFTREDPEKTAILQKTSTFVFRVSVLFTGSVCITGVFWGLFPYLKPQLELPLGYPDVDTSGLGFFIFYLYEIVCMILVGLEEAVADLLVGGLMGLVAAEMELLYYELSRIGREEHDPRVTTADPRGGCAVKIRDGINESRDYADAVACIKFHNEIINLVRELDDNFSLALLFQFAASSVIICGIAFQITISTDFMEKATMVFYLQCVVIELLVYCYFGDTLKSKSDLLSEGAYFSNWSCMSVRTRRPMQLLMARAQRPLALTAGNMFSVSLTTFTTVLRSSYSYFAMLNQRHVEGQLQSAP